MKRPHSNAFTLAELLIALAILGLIATFTIPKILSAQQKSSYKANAKEVASMIAAAYQKYRYVNGNASYLSMYSTDLTPYFNYVAVKTTGLIDGAPGQGSGDCSNAANMCLKLHNGGVLLLDTSDGFCSTTNTALWAKFDPDGIADGQAVSVQFWIYSTGKLTSGPYIDPTTQFTFNHTSCNISAIVVSDPSWFSWD